MIKTIHLCRFDSTLDLFKPPRRHEVRRTYEEIKARVLEAGRFSSFEASYNNATIAFFTRLARDSEVICDSKALGFPWIKVTRKAHVEAGAT